MRLGLTVVLVLAAVPALAAETRSCLATAGFEQVRSLALRCATVTHSGTVCRLEQPCGQMVYAIRQGCAALANNDPLSLPPFCGEVLPAR